MLLLVLDTTRDLVFRDRTSDCCRGIVQHVRLSFFSYSLYMSGMQCDLILNFQFVVVIVVISSVCAISLVIS